MVTTGVAGDALVLLLQQLARVTVVVQLGEPVLDRQDKTFSDDSVKERFRYEMIRYWLLEKPYRLEGVDYKRLTERIEQRRFDTVDILWSVDLAKIHAFLDLWQE